ncbi:MULTISPECIES: hypothetical protein [Aeromonas]|nr:MULTISPECIES: hypothetical protein [Aeromonas]MBF8449263.1 hypothetical protein [Aeromonas dhakensis]MCR3901550.1 hypothetical protein [Aeromonas hydrophila]WGY30656.1 hypothetical protein QK281_13610 [Aeromonas hydrophila]HDC4323468.1 hypothetical protein [Aeromonas hydrophila]
MDKRIIDSEDAFLNLANEFFSGQCTVSVEDIEFKGWPNVEIYLKGERYKGSLPATAMEGFLELNQALLQGYSEIAHGTRDCRSLRPFKQNLELVFFIKEGSSDTSAPADDFINQLITGVSPLMENMTGEQSMVVLLSLVFSVAGFWIFKTWQEQKTARSQSEEQTRQLGVMAQASATHADSLVKVVEVLGQPSYQEKLPPEIRQFTKTIEQGYESVAKHVTDADYARIGQQAFNREELAEFNRRKKRDKQKISAKSIGYVEAVKKKVENDYAVVTIETQSVGTFTLRADNFLLDDQMDLIYEGLKDDCPLLFAYDYVTCDNKFLEGRIVSVEKPSNNPA